MDKPVRVFISERGQITIPKKIRDKIESECFSCSFENGSIVLTPVPYSKEFLARIEASYEDYKKHGGISLEDLMKTYDL